MSQDESQADAHPVYVIESIPVGGANEISAAEIKHEGIPTPGHLRLYPELGRGGMGRIHPATDRNLLRHVGARARESRRDEPADAGRAADDDSRASFEAESRVGHMNGADATRRLRIGCSVVG